VAIMNTFDSRCTVGRHTMLRPGDRCTAGELLEDMDHHGVVEALVLDSLSRETHPEEGNRRILDVAAASPRLHAVWSALPSAGDDEQPDPETLLGQMRERGVAALFLFPRQYRFSLEDWCIDPFLASFAEAKVPVFFDYDEIGPGTSVSWDSTDWAAIVALCRRWPNLPVIVSESRIRRAQRVIYRALDACPNLRLEVSGLWLHRAIEYITEHWGADRLLFGSHWPSFGQHMTVATLATADIAETDRQRIADGNLRELIGWNRASNPVPVTFPKPADEFVQFGLSGHRPGSMTFLDCHGHMGGRAAHYHLPHCTLEGIVHDLDRFGVEKNCIFPFTGVSGDETFGNDTVVEAVRRYPGRFIGFTLLNPHRGPEEMRRELERGAARGLRGVKLIPYYQDYPEEGPNIDVACRWAHEHRQIILNHYWGSASQLDRLITTWPDACYITGHSTTEYAAIMKRHENLYVCSCPLLGHRACEEVVSAIGADRLLFGSDLQDLPIAWGLGPILFARIPPADKRLILGETLRKILRKYSLSA
jgi:predicted TIM-barrel fold metal-dependent hydrolase